MGLHLVLSSCETKHVSTKLDDKTLYFIHLKEFSLIKILVSKNCPKKPKKIPFLEYTLATSACLATSNVILKIKNYINLISGQCKARTGVHPCCSGLPTPHQLALHTQIN